MRSCRLEQMSPKEVELAQKDRYHEGLGPDYLRTPFKQPQVELAKAEAASNMFQQGCVLVRALFRCPECPVLNFLVAH